MELSEEDLAIPRKAKAAPAAAEVQVFPAAGSASAEEVAAIPTATGMSTAEETATAAAEDLEGESVLALGTEAAVDVQFRKIGYKRKEAVWYARGFEVVRCIPLTGDCQLGEAHERF